MVTYHQLYRLLNDFPPFLLYALITNGQRGWRSRRPTTEEIAIRMGIPERTMFRIVSQVSWDNVTFAQHRALLDMCGTKHVPRLREKTKRMMTGKKKFRHLKKDQLARLTQKLRKWMALRAC